MKVLREEVYLDVMKPFFATGKTYRQFLKVFFKEKEVA